MKPKFAVNDSVTTPTSSGTVKEVAPFKDHFEYLVEQKDKTATWYHEQLLKPATSSPATETPSTPK